MKQGIDGGAGVGADLRAGRGEERVLVELLEVDLLEDVVWLDEETHGLVHALVDATVELFARYGAVFFDDVVVAGDGVDVVVEVFVVVGSVEEILVD